MQKLLNATGFSDIDDDVTTRVSVIKHSPEEAVRARVLALTEEIPALNRTRLAVMAVAESKKDQAEAEKKALKAQYDAHIADMNEQRRAMTEILNKATAALDAKIADYDKMAVSRVAEIEKSIAANDAYLKIMGASK